MKTVLAIAGLDPSGGAGVLADARVAADHGVRLVSVVTALTVQDTAGVRAVEPVRDDVLAAQLTVLLHDVQVDAVKIGMIGDARAAPVIVKALQATTAPVVWDPILMPSRGGVKLLFGDVVGAVRTLLPETRLITPNLDEAETLAGTRVPRAAAEKMRRAGAKAVLIKGGHGLGAQSTDYLLEGDAWHELSSPRRELGALHGTGCVLSTAIACSLARDADLVSAVQAAKRYLDGKLARAFQPGRGAKVLV